MWRYDEDGLNQAGTELNKGQLKLGLGFTSVNCIRMMNKSYYYLEQAHTHPSTLKHTQSQTDTHTTTLKQTDTHRRTQT